MPGCGKTTLGKLLAEKLGKSFVDMDSVIEQTAGKSIPEIFAESGEAHFRSLETEAARSLGKEKGQVIATGGGVVLRPENMAALGQNGRIVFLQRPLDELAMEGRPLSKDRAALAHMYEVRLPLYEAYSQLSFQTVPGAEESAARLLALLD